MFDFPSVYHFSEKESEYHLYLGEYSTVDVLSKIDENSAIRITEFGATDLETNGYVSLDKLPALNSVKSVIAYLDGTMESMTLIDFGADVEGSGSISTHDDGECHIVTQSELACFEFVKKVAPSNLADALIKALKGRPNTYLRSDKVGAIQYFESFEDYIKADG